MATLDGDGQLATWKGVQALVEPVLAHRLLLARDAAIDGRSGADVLAEVVAAVAVPAEGGEDEPDGLSGEAEREKRHFFASGRHNRKAAQEVAMSKREPSARALAMPSGMETR